MKRWLVPMALAVVGLGMSSKADALTFSFGILVSGDTPLGSDWATLEITDSGLDTVNFALTHNNTSVEPQFISELYLNMTSLPGDLTPSFGSDIDSIAFGDDAFTDVANRFDVNVQFAIVPPSERLLPGKTSSWSMTGTGLDSLDFATLSTPVDGVPPMLAMLRLQGVGEDGEGSSKLAAVPEPTGMLALAFGGMALLGRRRRKN